MAVTGITVTYPDTFPETLIREKNAFLGSVFLDATVTPAEDLASTTVVYPTSWPTSLQLARKRIVTAAFPESTVVDTTA